MSSILGGLISGLIGGGVKRQKSRSNTVSQVSRSTPKEATPKAKTAAQLALIKTGSSGVLNEGTTGRRKLLGN